MAIFCVIVWGSTFVVSKDLLTHLLPAELMLLRFLLAYITIWIIYPKWYFHLREEWRFVLMALLANTLYAWAENTALTISLASNVSILVSTTPIMTALLIAVFHKEDRLSRFQTIGFGIAFLGWCWWSSTAPSPFSCIHSVTFWRSLPHSSGLYIACSFAAGLTNTAVSWSQEN